MFDAIRIFFSSPLNLTYLVFIILGICLIVYGQMGAKIAKRRSILKSVGNKEQHHDSFIDNYLDRISYIKKSEAKLDHIIGILDVDFSARSLTKAKLFCVVAAIALSIYLKNLLIAIPIVFILQYLPTTFVELKVNKKVKLFNDQILDAFQLFITEFTTTQSVQKSIVNICPKLKYPLRKEFERLARKLNSGESAETCFMEFARRTQNKWTLVFAQMMITYFRNGGEFIPHLMNITENISKDKVLDEQNTTELSSLKLVNLGMNALVPLAYISNRFINPSDAGVFVDTSQGRTILFCVAMSMLISLYLGQKITES